jgi:hypothetical protein
MLLGFLLTAAGIAGAEDLGVIYSVRVDNLSDHDVVFKLDGAKTCTTYPQGSCIWDIAYGSHTLDAESGGKHYSHDFELSDESDIQVRCKFDGAKFGGDSC